MTIYFLRVDFLDFDSLAFWFFAAELPDLLLPLLLRLEELTPVAFVDFFDVLAVFVFCPEEGFVADLFITVVADLRAVPLFCPDDLLVVALLVTVVVDLRVVLFLVPADCLS